MVNKKKDSGKKDNGKSGYDILKRLFIYYLNHGNNIIIFN